MLLIMARLLPGSKRVQRHPGAVDHFPDRQGVIRHEAARLFECLWRRLSVRHVPLWSGVYLADRGRATIARRGLPMRPLALGGTMGACPQAKAVT